MLLTTPASGASYVQFLLPNQDFLPNGMASAALSATIQFSTDLAATDTCNLDMFTATASGDFNNTILFCEGTQLQLKSEWSCTGSPNNPLLLNISSNHSYFIALQKNRGASTNAVVNKINVYDSDGTGGQMGTLLASASNGNCSTNYPTQVTFGDSSGAAGTSGKHVHFGAVRACYLAGDNACPFPLRM